ncbi:hypothetical protein LTR36_007182 [Oleoguttula mirabilis]|uniref:Uncharacterized protein n=1 Tax=Oleoguttula mirabilis TaxID=1507867 RepID=A0AAV9JA46_9PEZI|nr:hypothetical protein LTR36_007182 [Oleoguttula mirabilis]
MVNNSLIVLCCIAGAGIAVFLGWAMTHRFTRPVPDATTHAGLGNDFSQAQYMREVRLRHHDDLAVAFGGRRALDQAKGHAESWGTV